MHERLKTVNGKRLKVQRSSTVEPVLGTLLNFTGMRRIWTRGIRNANKFVLGAAIAYNLKKWLNWPQMNNSSTKKKAQNPLKGLEEGLSGAINTLFTVFETKKAVY